MCREYENVLSTTIDTSEIYQMNHRKPGERQFTVSDKTAEVLKKGLEYCEMSGGAFDITIEPLSRGRSSSAGKHSYPGGS